MAKKADSSEVNTSKKADKSESKKGADKKAASKKDARKKGGVKKYFRDLRSEIKKVVWPSREKVVNNTGVVLSVMIVMSLLLFGIDSLLMVAIKAILSIGA
ncbi:MAG: preprotein translocase subunit SecE [Ruminococcus sp.]|nr:preprotein translocase subunit SecE [Ruminococcus sp.]